MPNACSAHYPFAARCFWHLMQDQANLTTGLTKDTAGRPKRLRIPRNSQSTLWLALEPKKPFQLLERCRSVGEHQVDID
jgi:hypothetical protein